MKRIEFWLSVVCSLAASVASAATATTAEFRLSLKEDAIRESAGEETLCNAYRESGDHVCGKARQSESATWAVKFMV